MVWPADEGEITHDFAESPFATPDGRLAGLFLNDEFLLVREYGRYYGVLTSFAKLSIVVSRFSTLGRGQVSCQSGAEREILYLREVFHEPCHSLQHVDGFAVGVTCSGIVGADGPPHH